MTLGWIGTRDLMEGSRPAISRSLLVQFTGVNIAAWLSEKTVRTLICSYDEPSDNTTRRTGKSLSYLPPWLRLSSSSISRARYVLAKGCAPVQTTDLTTRPCLPGTIEETFPCQQLKTFLYYYPKRKKNHQQFRHVSQTKASTYATVLIHWANAK